MNIKTFIWWPELKIEIEKMVWNFSQSEQHQNTHAQLHLPPPGNSQIALKCLHIDYAGPFLGGKN